MRCSPPDVTEASARLAKIFDPGQQCCIGARINVQKFEAHSHLRVHHTDDCEHLYLLALVGECSVDPGADLQGAARTHKHPARERSEVTPLTRFPDCNSSISSSAAKVMRIEYRRSRTPDSLARLPLSDSMAVSPHTANWGVIHGVTVRPSASLPTHSV